MLAVKNLNFQELGELPGLVTSLRTLVPGQFRTMFERAMSFHVSTNEL
jgi:hypothetical protein